MTTLSFISPKSILVKIAEVFQVRDAAAPDGKAKVRNISDANSQNLRANTMTAKPKLNVSLDDLKTISTALLHYRRSLSKMGATDKAENVGKIDNMFYALIQDLEDKAIEEEINQIAA